MKSAWLKFLPLVLGIMLCVSCKSQNKKIAGNDNPFFQQPALKGITDKINNDPRNAALYYQRGNILHNMENDTLALQDFKKATALDSTKAEYFSAVGDLLFEHKDISGSVKWIQKAVELNPDDEKAQLKIAKLFLYIQDYPRAFTAADIVLRHDVSNAEAYFIKGMLYKDLKDTTKAMSNLLTAVQMDPNYREAIIELGQFYSWQKNPVALKYYDNAFRIDSSDVFPLFAKGVFYQNMNNWEMAKAEYTNCILHDSQYPGAYFNMGWILLQQDSVVKAKRQYDIVTKVDPTNAGAYYNRGLCSELLHDKADAISDYKQALIFNSKYKEAQEGLKRLGAKATDN